MRINHNIAALNTYRQLSTNTTNTSKSLEKLSSGLRINRAGDDAAGLAISEKMRGQIRGLDQASRNANDGISLIQTAEGALAETHSILQRMRELAVQSSNDTNTESDRTEIQKEINQLTKEIDRISTDTEFNTKKLLDGSMATTVTSIAGTDLAADSSSTAIGVSMAAGTSLASGTYSITVSYTAAAGGNPATFSVAAEDADGNAVDATSFAFKYDADFIETLETAGVNDTFSSAAVVVNADKSMIFHIGANAGQKTELSINNMDAKSLGIDSLNLTTQPKADEAITTIDSAISAVSSQRAALGGMQNRLEHTINNLGTTSENLAASESRIRDVDMAKEMMEFTKNNILSQASQAMLAQANQQPQSVLQLLQ
jgi:flagellin